MKILTSVWEKVICCGSNMSPGTLSHDYTFSGTLGDYFKDYRYGRSGHLCGSANLFNIDVGCQIKDVSSLTHPCFMENLWLDTLPLYGSSFRQNPMVCKQKC